VTQVNDPAQMISPNLRTGRLRLPPGLPPAGADRRLDPAGRRALMAAAGRAKAAPAGTGRGGGRGRAAIFDTV